MFDLRSLTVADAYHHEGAALIVGPDEDFSHVIERFADHPNARGIFVADADKHLLGIITRTDMLDWARAKLGALLHARKNRKQERTMRLITLMHASTAGQVMHPDSNKAAVRETDSLARAMRLMIDLDLIVLPVVNERGQIIEDLKLEEILVKAVKVEQAR